MKISEEFIEELISTLPQNIKNSFSKNLKQKFIEEAKVRLGIFIMQELKAEQSKKLLKLIEIKTSPKKIEDFLKNNIKNYKSKSYLVLKNFKKELLNNL